jgi:hypothetical protein
MRKPWENLARQLGHYWREGGGGIRGQCESLTKYSGCGHGGAVVSVFILCHLVGNEDELNVWKQMLIY